MLRPLTFETPPAASLLLSVVIPVRDEVALLPCALAAFATQTDLDGRPLDPACYEILVFANNCRDGSAAAARRFARQHPRLRVCVAEGALPAGCGNVGTARRLLMDAACRRLPSPEQGVGVIASTDGDTVVASDWVAQTLREIKNGADAVGGRISVCGQQTAGERLYHLRDVTYQHLTARLEALLDPDPADPCPRHRQFFGGSLAVTAAAYRLVGGLPAVPCLEDVALQRALQRVDARLRHSRSVCATTSARQCGRAPVGLASQLREWSGMAHRQAPHMVQDPAALAVRFQSRARLRRLWRDAQAGQGSGRETVAPVADALCVPAKTLMAALSSPGQPFGVLWDRVVDAHEIPNGPWARRWPLRPIAAAITDLRACLSAQTRPAGTSLPAGR